ncbi:drug/metabolite transporter (DMT)-like permease [Rhodococcus sp. 27YEA15]|uniref:DMT family transporter n=1 Tax=Rhodococcus sp. 27YEA15 TaxID=3156259 RepID=UPI003C7C48FF
MGALPLISILCALAAALLFACASVAQQSAASAVPEDGALISTLIRTPRWWAGLVGDGGGYVMQALALAMGSVLVVQPLIVASLLFALPLSAKFSGIRITRSAWSLAILLAAALAVFLVVGDPTEGNENAPWSTWTLPLALTVAVATVATLAGLSKLDSNWRALLLGSAAGIFYGVAVAFTKYVTDLFGHGLGGVLTAWQTWALIASGILGVYLQQRAFQVGPLSASLPALTIGEPIAAIFLGMTVLGERLRVDGAALALVTVSVIVMIAAAVGLSRSQARDTAGVTGPSPVPS